MKQFIKQFNFDKETGACVAAGSGILFNPKARSNVKSKFYKENKIFLGELHHDRYGTMLRAVIPVRHWINNSRLSKKLLFADAVTGTIYEPRTGRCLSSSLITLKKVHTHATAQAIELLKEARSLDDTVTA